MKIDTLYSKQNLKQVRGKEKMTIYENKKNKIVLSDIMD